YKLRLLSIQSILYLYCNPGCRVQRVGQETQKIFAAEDRVTFRRLLVSFAVVSSVFRSSEVLFSYFIQHRTRQVWFKDVGKVNTRMFEEGKAHQDCRDQQKM